MASRAWDTDAEFGGAEVGSAIFQALALRHLLGAIYIYTGALQPRETSKRLSFDLSCL